MGKKLFFFSFPPNGVTHVCVYVLSCYNFSKESLDGATGVAGDAATVTGGVGVLLLLSTVLGVGVSS